ncbi:MAG TPA: type I polyketide synthase, partial [Polyangiales bacterium]|nr:type I polyketide synthase [Polyangiales bacterium]
MTTEATTQRLELLLRRSMKSLLKTETVLEAERAARREPIAIVSMACRLPGGIVDPESYWELLEEGQDAVEEFPPRWQSLDVYDPDPDAIGKSYTREGGFMRDVELFDAGFFGTGAREARAMDPQHRLLLETAWEALERAGIQPSSLNESLTGVYVGAMGSDYGSGQGGGLEALDGYIATGTATSVLSGRVAYLLGLQGPALTVDTACSSSLTAIHLACAGLRQRECDLALVGGVTVMSTPGTFVEFSRLRMISPEGRCKSFSAQADGVGCSEGCGVLVLKRLSDAQRDGDRVLALVRGSAVNQDGRSQGLAAPNGPAQQRVIRDALASAGLSPSEVDALEAHATGTSLGDPVEAGALSAVFGPERAPERPLYLGTSKSNLGHTQAASGVTGVIKMVLSLQHELLPKTLHAEERSPHVAWEGSGLSLLQEAREWKRGERVRRAGVSSFGISGTNAHVVLEEAPRPAAAEAPSAAESVAYALPLLVSGRDEAALRSQAQRLHDWLAAHPEARWVDVVHTAALHRAHFDERAVVIAPDGLSSLQALEALAKGQHDARVVHGRVGAAGASGKVVFVFPDQGSEWQGMGKALLEQSEVFAQRMRECDAALSRWTGWSVVAVLRGEESDELPSQDHVDVVQASLFAMYVSLSALWRSWGLEPVAVVGVGQGEVAAAVVSGALSLEDGARVVAARGHALRMRCGDGGMMLVECPVAEVEELLPRYGSALSIAAVHTASSLVVSGDNAALESLQAKLESASVSCRALDVDHASHSTQMDLLLPGLLEELSTLSPCAGEIPLYSTLEGRRLEGTELDGSYWCRNLREPVRLDRALTQLLEDGHGVFVEVSPHPVLGGALRSASDVRDSVVIGSLAREQGELSSLLRGLGELHAHGCAVDWKKVLSAYGGCRVDLPTYAFQRERFWLETGKTKSDLRSVGLAAVEHPLLGAMTPLADSDGYLFSSLLSVREQAWLRDYAVAGTVLLPGVSMLELALHAGRALGFGLVRELVLGQPLVLPADGGVQLQLSVGSEEEAGTRSVALYSRTGEGAWVQHATGELSPGAGLPVNEELRSWPVALSEPVELSGFHARMARLGFEYGPAFQGLRELRRAGQVAYGRVVIPDSIRASAEHYDLHPALFDAALHTLLAFMPEGDAGEILLPFAWSDVQLYATGASELRVRAELVRDEVTGQLTAALEMSDGSGELVARVGAVQLRAARLPELRRLQSKQIEHLYRVEWQPALLEVATTSGEQAVVLGGEGELARQLGATWYAELEALLARAREGLRPARVIVDATQSNEPALLPALHAGTAEALSQLQALLSEPGLSESELVWVTSSTAECSVDRPPADLVCAPSWGLIRSARSEHGERSLRLVDVDRSEQAREVLSRGLCASREPELMLRGGVWLAARLVRAGAVEPNRAEQVRCLNPAGTVLITGGTGELGSALAEHLVAQHGVKRLVLTSRRGADALGTEELIEKLSGLGAESVEVLSCDVTVRSELASVLSSIPGEHPLTGVFHLSAVLDDGLLQAQTAERLSAVLAPKVDGAWHLHELTEGQDLACFVLFSSAAGTLGNAGQSNYAAANTFLDALAAHRQ